MQKRSVVLLFSIAAIVKTIAAPVDSIVALVQALTFLRTTQPATRTLASDNVRPFAAGRAAYGFAATDGRFVLVAADDRLPDVLGYGRTGDTLPPALDGLLRLYERQLATPPAARAAEARTTRPVAPLLRSVRHQRDPFNRSCPYYIDDAGQPSATRCVVGCVATALEQVLTYYRQPAALADTVFAHTTAHFSTTDVAPGTSIDWPHILDVYAEGQYSDAEARAVADLSLWCGQMAQMDWGTRESGAYVSRLAAPVSRSLGYDYVHYADSYQYRPDEWMDMLLAEIQGGRPVVYAGGIYAQSAHAFVLDGVDAEGRFHVNWGYGGAYDGYFRLDVLNPFDPTATGGTVGQAQGFFCNQEALLLHPAALDVRLPDTLGRTGQELRLTSLQFERRPDLNDAVAVRLGLHNTCDAPLTTTLALVTYAPDAAEPFEEAEVLGYTAVRLAAGQDSVVTAYARFQTPGQRVFALTADGASTFYTQALRVDSTAAALLTVTSITAHAEPDRVRADITFHNAATAGWAGDMPTFSLFEGDYSTADGEPRRYAHLNLAPGADTVVTVCFDGLRPATRYTLCVRLDWLPDAQYAFTTPAATGIASPPADAGPVRWLTPDGRPVTRPDRPGVYLRQRGREVHKVTWPVR